jgi:A/G-specific adenine glycosylase
MSSEQTSESTIDAVTFQADLLGWYDTHKRVMPWRAKDGQRPDPYHVWLSEVMLQQTTVAAVHDYFLKFIARWPDVKALAAADMGEVMQAWAGLGYYTRARNLYKCAQILAADYDGQFPEDEKELQKLPGIGPYTAAAIAAIAFDRPSVAVDGNVERVGARLFEITTPFPEAKPFVHDKVRALYHGIQRPGDFVQAMMELGATICRPKSPQCLLCPVRRHCHAFAHASAEDLPKKQRKKARPHKYGYVYIIQSQEGNYLLETRPQNGLLGGMPGLPHSGFDYDVNACTAPPFINNGQAEAEMLGENHFIMHSFTHFDLTLFVCAGMAYNNKTPGDGYYWVEPAHFTDEGLPRLFQKVVQYYLSL